MIASFRWVFAAVTIVGCVAAAGCSSAEKDQEKQEKKDRREARRLERQRQREQDRGVDPVIGRRNPDRLDRDTRDTRRSTRGIDEIPTSASRVDEGNGPRLTYSPRRDGTLYVYDADDDRVVYSGGVRADDRFSLDPADRATVNGRTVLGTNLNPNHRYRIYFDPGR
jgi:hypothetical protein